MGYSALFTVGEGEGGEGEEWRPTSVTPFLIQVGSLTANSLTAIGYGPTLF